MLAFAHGLRDREVDFVFPHAARSFLIWQRMRPSYRLPLPQARTAIAHAPDRGGALAPRLCGRIVGVGCIARAFSERERATRTAVAAYPVHEFSAVRRN